MRPSKIVELPTRLLVQALGSERRFKHIGIIGGISLVVLGVGAYFTVATLETRSQEAMGAELGALQSCLLGDPLAADEKPSNRLRRVQLAALSIPTEKRGKANELLWPTSCAGYAFSLSARHGGPEEAGLGKELGTLGKALKEDAWGPKLPGLVDGVFKEIGAKGIKAIAVTNVPVAPKAVEPVFDNAKFAGLPKMLSGKFRLAQVKSESAPRQTLRFVLDTKDGPDGTLLCTATGGATAAVKCSPVPGSVAATSPVGLGGTAEAGALLAYSAGLGDNASVFLTETKVASGQLLGAHSRTNGTASVLIKSGKDAKLVVVPATGAPQDRGPVDSTIVSAMHMGLGYDQVAWFGKGGGKPHLFARKLGPNGLDASPAVDLGEIVATPSNEATESLIDFCKTDEATIVRGRAGQTDIVAILAAGRWSIPMKGGPAGGTLTCRGLDAIATHIEHQVTEDRNWATITHTKCNPGGCTVTKLPMREIIGSTPELGPTDSRAIAAADIGGKLALVWSAGAAGGVRIRFGAPDQLKQAPDVVICDGQEEGAPAGLSSFVEMKLMPMGEDALLLMSTTSGVRAMRIDKAGAVTSVQVSK